MPYDSPFMPRADEWMPGSNVPPMPQAGPQLTDDEVYRRLLANRNRQTAPAAPAVQAANPLIDRINSALEGTINAGPGSEVMFTSSDPRSPSNRWQSGMPAMVAAYNARLNALGQQLLGAQQHQLGTGRLGLEAATEFGLNGIPGRLQTAAAAIEQSGRPHTPQAQAFQLNQGLLAAGLAQGREPEDVLQSIEGIAPRLQGLVGRLPGAPTAGAAAPVDMDRERIRIANDMGIPPQMLGQMGGGLPPPAPAGAAQRSVQDVMRRLVARTNDAPPRSIQSVLSAARSQLGPRWRESLPEVITFLQSHFGGTGPAENFGEWWQQSPSWFSSSPSQEARTGLRFDIEDVLGERLNLGLLEGALGGYNLLPGDIVQRMRDRLTNPNPPLPAAAPAPRQFQSGAVNVPWMPRPGR